MPKLREIADISIGYTSRKGIDTTPQGPNYLLQAKDVDGETRTYRLGSLVRFSPASSTQSSSLKKGDIVFMARGSRNFSVLMSEVPEGMVAAACFFLIRLRNKAVFPAYLAWFLNTEGARNYFVRHTGKGVHMPVVRRATLENLEVPIPSLESQKRIAELYSLARQEQSLLEELQKKRALLVERACIKTIKNT
jgi:Type I restriction modification DNA specificity domain